MASVAGNGKGAATLRIGIVGLGGGASDMIPAFVQHPHITLSAAADIDPGQLEHFQGEFHGETYLNAEELCQSPQVDVVYIATPNQFHTAHALLAGLDPSDEMAFCLAHDKLGSVHLNDQNGLKYDQDKNFGAANLRAAFNQVRVLEEAGYCSRGEFVGPDVKTMRTHAGYPGIEHLKISRQIFLHLVDKVRSYDRARVEEYRARRDYEALELYTVQHLMGVR